MSKLNFIEDVSANIKDAMRDRGVTPTALATATGIPRTTLARNLKNGGQLTVPRLSLISDALGVDFPSLFAKRN